MVSTMTLVCCIVTLLVSLLLPALILVGLIVRNQKRGLVSAWLLGAAGFFVTQMLIRVPVLTMLQGQSWFQTFAQNQLFAYAFSLAFTAGLFELAGRYAVALLMRKNLTRSRALAAGFGHGGIEAMLLVGMTYINNLLYIVMINSGAFDGLLAETAALGVDVSQLEMIRQQLLAASPGLFLLAGYERILTMISHTAMSMLVCFGVAHKKTLSCLLICLGIHTCLDLVAGVQMLVGNVLSQTAAYIFIYTILTATAAVSLMLIRKLYCTWRTEEATV